MSEPSEREIEVFNAALELPAAERAIYLDNACAGDAALRQRVEDLLAAGDQAGCFLDSAAISPPGPGGSTRPPAVPSEKPGDRIGRYKLLQQIGEGGCGVVYMAEQEEPVRRRVALKVIKLGMDTKQVIARFEAERQAVALMDHPNIAKVLDAGATETGRPYFVMELVRGVKITDYCDENNLSTVARLELFVLVCQAIQHAHQKGIIHRDIKPSNILVADHDGVPVPKIIDFGIAKATTDQRLTDKTLFTAFEQFIGTPAYMSPEQAKLSGLDIDTRSDIYSLGVLLYELLTGQTPFDAKKLLQAGLDEIRRTIRQDEPPRPSTCLSTMLGADLTEIAKHRKAEPPKLIHLVRGDLDWIVMKSLEKDRTRRYETANGLVADIQRHLNNEPVVARPPTAAYRLQKSFHRNKVVFTAGIAVATAMLLGTIVSIWQAVRATHATRVALGAQAQALTAQAGEKVQRQKAEALAEQNWQNYLIARQNLYAADIAQADRAVNDANYVRARQLLDGQRPKAGEPDLRGIEWRYLWATSRGDQIVTLDAGAAVDGVNVSSDGKLIAAASADGTVKLWDCASLQLIASMGSRVASEGKITGPTAFSPDGRVMVSSDDQKVRLWDRASHTLLKEMRADWPQQLAFSPDGKLLAVASGDKRGTTEATGLTLLFDASTGEELAELPESGGHAVAFSRDGKLLATGPWDGSTKIWDVPSQRVVQILQTGGLLSLCFSADNGSLFTINFDGLKLWNPANGSLEKTLSTAAGLDNLKLSPDGKLLACGFRDGTIELWNVVEGKLAGTLRGHQSAVRGLAFTPDGTMLVSGALDKTVRIWSTTFAATPPSPSTSAQLVEAFELGAMCRFSTDSKWLVMHTGAGNRSRIMIVDVEQCRVCAFLPTLALPIGLLPGGHKLLALDISQTAPAGRSVMSPWGVPEKGKESASHIELWDWEAHTNQVIPLRNVPPDGVTAFALSPDGKQLVITLASSQMGKRTLYSVDPRSGECIPQNLALNATALGGLAFSPDGHYLAVGDGRKTLLCHWPEVSNFMELGGHLDSVQKPHFSPDGAELVTGDNVGEVRVWEMPSGKLLFAPSSQETRVTMSASFSADNLTLVTDARDTARLWHRFTGRELISFNNTHSIEFSPDGKVMARVGVPDEGKRFEYPLYLAHLPTLQDIDNSQPQQTLAELGQAAKSKVGLFEPVIGDAGAISPANADEK